MRLGDAYDVIAAVSRALALDSTKSARNDAGAGSSTLFVLELYSIHIFFHSYVYKIIQYSTLFLLLVGDLLEHEDQITLDLYSIHIFFIMVLARARERIA